MAEGMNAGFFRRLMKAARDFADPVLDGLVVLGLINRSMSGDKAKYEIDPKALRQHAPRFSKKIEHESRWAAITAKLDPNMGGHRQLLLVHFMFNLHEEQQADLIQSAADASQLGNDGEERVLIHLRHVVELPTLQQQINYLDSLNWIKKDPNEYWIVKLQTWAECRFDNLQDIGKWANDPNGPVIRRLNQFAANARARTVALRAHQAAIARPQTAYHHWDPAVQRRSVLGFWGWLCVLAGSAAIVLLVVYSVR